MRLHKVIFILASASFLVACSSQRIEPSPLSQSQLVKQVRQAAQKSIEQSHPKAWEQLQLAQAYLKEGDLAKAREAFAQSHQFYQNLYGRYSVRIAEFDTTAADYAFQAKAWDLANLYYLKSLKVHQAMAVLLPAKVQYDLKQIHTVFLKTKNPQALDQGYHSALYSLKAIHQQSEAAIASMQANDLSLLKAQDSVVKKHA